MNLILSPRFVEPLETRIAPALAGILVGDPGANDTGFFDLPFRPTTNVDPTLGAIPNYKANFDVADSLGANFVPGDTTFYIALDGADKTANLIQLFGADGYKPFISVKKGHAVAFFVDGNMDGEVSSNELTGLSLGKDAVVEIGGSLIGDIVTNFDDATGQIVQNSLIGPTQGIAGLTLDSAAGIIAGGAIKKATGKVVDFVYTGTGANGYGYDFNGDGFSDAGGGLVVGPFADGVAGPGITDLSLVETTAVVAGAGGAGAVGGSIKNAIVIADSNGFTIQAGNGGAGNAAKTAGGNGGTVSQVFAPGSSDGTPGGAPVLIGAGDGGNGFFDGADRVGKGGNGGTVGQVYVGFNKVSNKPEQSATFVQDSVLVSAGDGGIGKTGGNGGGTSDIRVLSLADTLAVDIDVQAGDGGASDALAGGKGGKGGSIVSTEAKLLDGGAVAADARIEAGDGGAAAGVGGGSGDGGSISKTVISAYGADILAGDAGAGSAKGGLGGSVTDLTFLPEPGSLSLFTARSFMVNAGNGGNAGAGSGGKGGGITKVRAEGIEVSMFSAVAGNGGVGGTGKGGIGGGLTDIRVFDFDFSVGVLGSFFANAGNGGDGSAGAGAGGGISKTFFVGGDVFYVVTSGNGGDCTVAGSGANGGSIVDSAFSTIDGQGVTSPTGSVIAGFGGNGLGSGKAGNGGSITKTNSGSVGDSDMTAGDGGTSGTGSVGAGGSIKNAAASASDGDVRVFAGAAGAAGGKGAAGGSIEKLNVVAEDEIQIVAGDGGVGGSGGNVKGVGFSGETSGVAPQQAVTIQAGNGIGGASGAGKGGSIDGVTGLVAQADFTTIQAGNGSASTAGTIKTAAGGSVLNTILTGGGGATAKVVVGGGDGGGSPLAKSGAKGGDVKNLTVGELDAGTLFRSVAAGDGGDADPVAGKGGAGGSTTLVAIAGDLGDRSGVAFGFDSMGGLFTGRGGTGFTTGVSGKALDVNADMIAAIVAGKILAGQPLEIGNLVSEVNRITLNGMDAPTLAGGASGGDDGGSADFRRFSIASNPDPDPLVREIAYEDANFVGATNSPFAVDGNQFTTTGGKVAVFAFGDVPLDGFVAALVYPTGSKNQNNFVPEALITVDAGGNAQLIDNNNLL